MDAVKHTVTPAVSYLFSRCTSAHTPTHAEQGVTKVPAAMLDCTLDADLGCLPVCTQNTR